jgi:hypothetical protein
MKTIIAATIALTLSTGAALAWGDDGHKVVALIAEHYLTPSAKKQVDSLLAADTDGLTAHDIASEATWADRYRDSNNRRDHYNDTKNWNFVDLEIEDPDITKACFGRKPLPSDTPASIGPPSACVGRADWAEPQRHHAGPLQRRLRPYCGLEHEMAQQG